jgi:UDP-glucose 4-epimerase
MRVLVTGSSGQLGSFVCELLADSHEVIGMDIRESAFPSTRSLTELGDITDEQHVRKAVTDVDAVIHCAAQVSVERSFEDPVTDLNTNVLGTVNLLHASSRSGVKKFLYVSSAAVYGNPRSQPIPENHPTEPMSNYGASKLAGERFALSYAHSSHLDVVVVRPFNFYSPRADPASPYSGVITKFVSRVREGKPPIIEGDGGQTRDFIHASDVASMLVSVIEKDGLSPGVFNCGSGTPTSIMELARIAISVSGNDLEAEFTGPRKGDIRHSLADITRAKELLGFSPRISLEQGISELLS